MTIKLTRAELYNYIWKDGTSRTAERLNTTADKIKSAALKANVPLPSNSYWGHLHMGTNVTKTKLPDPNNQSIINIPERKLHSNHNHLTSTTKIPLKRTNAISSQISQNIFTDIPLKYSDSINLALQQVKVPKVMPSNPEPLVAEIINQAKEEKKANQIGSVYMPYRNKSTINFHGRFGIKPTKEALTILNTLLKAFNKANAKITLATEKNDVLIELEGATLTLSCHIPSHRVLLKPDDKRWEEWHDTDFEPTGEKICFAIKLQHAWDSQQIHHRKQEAESDYVKRIFIKTIRLIPDSRKIVYDDQLAEIKREEEKVAQAHLEEKHREAYTKLKDLLDMARAHQVSLLLRNYIQDTSFKDQQTLDWASHQANWLDGQESSDILKESDKQKLIADFFKVNDQHSIF